MKFKRRPVQREIVDALKVEKPLEPVKYLVQRPNGEIEEVEAEKFERDYEPVKRERAPTPRKRTKKVAPPVAAVA